MRLSLSFLFLVIFATACATGTPAPTPTPPSTATTGSTPLPTLTGTAIQAPQTPLPTGTILIYGSGNSEAPLTVWNGIPIASGAVMGTGNNTTYRYITSASLQQVQAFYGTSMVDLGWSLFSASNTGGNFTYVYIKGDVKLTITITPQGSFTVVVLTKGA